MTGSQKYGPKRRSYSRLDTMLEKTVGLMSRSSRRRYMLVRKTKRCSSVWQSVARPVRPHRVLSFTWNVFLISQEMVWLRRPYRLSLAMATQFLPAIAITAEPLYDMIDMAIRRARRDTHGSAGSEASAARASAEAEDWCAPVQGWQVKARKGKSTHVEARILSSGEPGQCQDTFSTFSVALDFNFVRFWPALSSWSSWRCSSPAHLLQLPRTGFDLVQTAAQGASSTLLAMASPPKAT